MYITCEVLKNKNSFFFYINYIVQQFLQLQDWWGAFVHMYIIKWKKKIKKKGNQNKAKLHMYEKSGVLKIEKKIFTR